MIKLQDGTRITRSKFDDLIRKAKAKKLQIFLEDHEYIFCEVCARNDCKPVDCSHDVSVSECIKNGTPELAYDENNITLRGRNCHAEYDGLDIKKPKI